MGDKTAIQWTDATWNPVTGCSKVSPGCAHCYAESLTRRFSREWGVPDLPWTPANAAQNVILHPERLDQPLRWRRPRMVFVNSMSDLFHELVPDEYVAAVFAVMNAARQHIFQVLTKRPGRMCALLSSTIFWDLVDAESCGASWGESRREDEPLPNVWLGTSIENRRFIGRALALRATPAAVRFISAEPLLGPLLTFLGQWPGGFEGPELELTGIDWLIVGGESGPDHRPMRREWVRDLRAACEREGTAFFFKQWGGRTPKAGGRQLDGRTWDQMPNAEALAHG